MSVFGMLKFKVVQKCSKISGFDVYPYQKHTKRIGFVESQEGLTLITSDNTSSLTNGDGGSGKAEVASLSTISSGTSDEEPCVVLVEEAWCSFEWEFTRNEEPLLVLIEETCCSCNWECDLVRII